MEEVIRLVSEKTGLPPETARTAVETVLGYLKEKLPAPIAGQIDALLGSGGAPGESGGPFGNLGGLLG